MRFAIVALLLGATSAYVVTGVNPQTGVAARGLMTERDIAIDARDPYVLSAHSHYMGLLLMLNVVTTREPRRVERPRDVRSRSRPVTRTYCLGRKSTSLL